MLWKKMFRRQNPVELRLDELRSAICSDHADDSYKRMAELAFRVMEFGDAAIQPLYAALEDPNPWMRHWAALALTRAPTVEARVRALVTAASSSPLGPIEEATKGVAAFGVQAAGPLLAALKSHIPDVRGRVADALGKLGRAVVETLLPALDDPDPFVRAATAQALCKIADPRALPRIIELMNDAEDVVRRDAAWNLGFFHDPSAVPPLINILERGGEGFSVRLGAAYSLLKLGWIPSTESQQALIAVLDLQGGMLLPGSYNDPIGKVTRYGEAAVEYLIMALETSIWDVTREAAAKALGRIGDERAIPALTESLGSTNYSVGEAAGSALVALGPKGVTALVNKMMSVETRVRCEAARALGNAKAALANFHDAATEDTLVAALLAEDSEVRKGAIYALENIGDARTAPALVLSIGDPNPNVRDAAAGVLERAGQTELGRAAVEPLIEILTHGDPAVRARAVQILWKTRDSRAVAPLAKLMASDPGRGVRRLAAHALGACGGEYARQALESAKNDPDSDVRNAAAEALKNM